jgi:hypothetical protein
MHLSERGGEVGSFSAPSEAGSGMGGLGPER